MIISHFLSHHRGEDVFVVFWLFFYVVIINFLVQFKVKCSHNFALLFFLKNWFCNCFLLCVFVLFLFCFCFLFKEFVHYMLQPLAFDTTEW